MTDFISMKTSEFCILVVDDEQVLRENLGKTLALDGYKILFASGGREAIEIVKTQAIDFIISDVRMPHGDGIELLQEVRKINPDIPVVVLVTGFTELTKESALSMGAIDLLQKPINLDTIELYIQSALQRRNAA